MDFKESSGSWIYAYQSSGGPKNSDDKSATIRQHSEDAVFSWDFANAKGGSSANPLVNASPSGTGSGGSTATSCIPRSASATVASSGSTPTQTSSDSDSNDNDNRQTTYASGRPTAWPTARPTSRPFDRRDDLPYCDEISSGDGNSNAGFTPISSSRGGNQRTMLIAHGVLASLAFVILFPAGAIAIRLASFPGIVWLHAAFQVFAYLVYIAGFGLGVYLATEMNLLNSYHPVIGIVVFVLVFFQPILGFLHHTLFKKYNHRTLWSYAHIWLGRIAVTLGIINGGLGLRLADSMMMSSRGGIIAYGVIAGLVWLVWVAAMFVGERRRKRARGNAPGKYAEESSTRRESDRSDTAAINGHYAPKNQ